MCDRAHVCDATLGSLSPVSPPFLFVLPSGPDPAGSARLVMTQWLARLLGRSCYEAVCSRCRIQCWGVDPTPSVTSLIQLKSPTDAWQLFIFLLICILMAPPTHKGNQRQGYVRAAASLQNKSIEPLCEERSNGSSAGFHQINLFHVQDSNRILCYQHNNMCIYICIRYTPHINAQ